MNQISTSPTRSFNNESEYDSLLQRRTVFDYSNFSIVKEIEGDISENYLEKRSKILNHNRSMVASNEIDLEGNINNAGAYSNYNYQGIMNTLWYSNYFLLTFQKRVYLLRLNRINYEDYSLFTVGNWFKFFYLILLWELKISNQI